MSQARRPNPSLIPHQLLSAVSHELRGPLGVARGYLRLLEPRVAGDAAAQRSVEQAAAAATRMAELLEELSEYARWVRGESTLTLEPMRLRELLTIAADLAAARVPAEVRVLVDAPADLTVEVDAARLAPATAALAAALARSQTSAAAIALASDGASFIRIAHPGVPGERTDRPAAIERAGAGLTIALAEILIARHGWRLVEHWVGNNWVGYELKLTE